MKSISQHTELEYTSPETNSESLGQNFEDLKESNFWIEFLKYQDEQKPAANKKYKKASGFVNRVSLDIANRKFREQFLKAPVKIMILPRDIGIKLGNACKSLLDRQVGLNVCQLCEEDCPISQITLFGKSKNLQVFLLNLSTQKQQKKIMNLLKKNFKEFAIISLADLNEFSQLKDLYVNLNIPVQCISYELDDPGFMNIESRAQELIKQIKDIIKVK